MSLTMCKPRVEELAACKEEEQRRLAQTARREVRPADLTWQRKKLMRPSAFNCRWISRSEESARSASQ
jgi:hypothetical protein